MSLECFFCQSCMLTLRIAEFNHIHLVVVSPQCNRQVILRYHWNATSTNMIDLTRTSSPHYNIIDLISNNGGEEMVRASCHFPGVCISMVLNAKLNSRTLPTQVQWKASLHARVRSSVAMAVAFTQSCRKKRGRIGEYKIGREVAAVEISLPAKRARLPVGNSQPSCPFGNLHPSCLIPWVGIC